ncbi:MAG TPA: riboflavin biosynthesis protein RibF [Verrucomicrobiae bacterium]|jgi:riboflavin kinase/FMN adenylyltransferase
MKVISDAADLNPGPRSVCAAIGVFDGVHLGHQHVLRQTIAEAERHGAVAAAVTFDRHPNAVVAPAHVPPLIYPLDKKLEVIASCGVEAACVIRFDKAFSQIPGEQFIRDLARDFRQIQSICVGAEFGFGAHRSGNVALMEKLGAELGFAVHALRDVELDGQSVSSTRIRDAIRAGDFGLASRMLARPYVLRGAVIQGEHLGRKLGFPTANLDVTGLVTPPLGVYAAMADMGASQFRAAVNIGHRPTIHSADPQLHVEAHLLDFEGDLYGKALELTFVKKLRDEKKFPDLAALRAQIASDVERARKENPI